MDRCGAPKNVKLIILVLSMAIFCLLVYNNFAEQQQRISSAECPSSEPLKVLHNNNWNNYEIGQIPTEKILDYFLWTNRAVCPMVNYFGGVIGRRLANSTVLVGDQTSDRIAPISGLDGHYAVCFDPIPVAPHPDRCTAYSFGIRNDWSYDEMMERFGCQVFSFDPTLERPAFERSPKNHFFDTALDDEDRGPKNLTLKSIYEKLKAHHGEVIIDHVKIDIEGSEWRILPEIIRSGMLDKLKQLAVEVHLDRNQSDAEYFHRMAGVVQSLEDAGMVRFDSYYNFWTYTNFPGLGNRTGYYAYIMAWYNSKYTE